MQALDLVRSFLAHGVDATGDLVFGGAPFAGATPLHVAANQSMTETAEHLVERGAKVNVKGLFGLAAISSLAGFVFHLLTGNPDMALMCFAALGGIAAMVWMFTTWRRA